MRQLLVVVLQCTKTRDARAESCFANLRPLPHDHTYPDIFGDGDPSQSMRNAHCKSCMRSSYSKTSVFVLQCKREASVFKNLHSGERFWENEFSVIVFTGYVRMVGETRDKKPPFSNKNGYVWTGHKTLSTRIRIFLKTDIFFSAFEKYASSPGVLE